MTVHEKLKPLPQLQPLQPQQNIQPPAPETINYSPKMSLETPISMVSAPQSSSSNNAYKLLTFQVIPTQSCSSDQTDLS